MGRGKYRPEYMAHYREEHREAIRAYHAAWLADHPESLNQYAATLRKKRLDFIQRLKAVPCADCGIQYPPYVMDFDHKPGQKKIYTLSDMLMMSETKILAEAKKCDVVCANCHRIRTWIRRHGL